VEKLRVKFLFAGLVCLLVCGVEWEWMELGWVQITEVDTSPSK
jgi:hypothetical protein